MIRQHIWKANALYEGNRVLRSRGLFFQLFVGGVFVVVALVEGALVEQMISAGFTADTLPPALVIMQSKLMGGGFNSDPLMTVYGFALQLLIPGVALLFGANQFNEDVVTGHTRILLSRMSRRELVLSRFISTLIQWSLVVGGAATLGALLLNSETQTWVTKAGFTTVSPVMMGLACVAYGAPCLAYASLLNTIFRKQITVVIGGWALWSLPELLFTLAPELESALESIWPEPAGMHLLLPDGDLWLGLGLAAAYTGLFLWAAIAIFQRKELR